MKHEDCKSCISNKRMAASVLTCEELDLLSSNTNQLHCSENVDIFMQNNLTTDVYYLKEGIVKLYTTKNNRNVIIKIITAPSYLSLASTLSRDTFFCSAMTITKSVICITNRKIYKDLISKNSVFALQIIKHLSENELDQCKVCTSLLQQNLNGRIASNLLFFSQNVYKNTRFKLNRKELSEIICQSRENISRVISQFAREEILSVNGSEIEILDFKRLENIRDNG